MIPSCGFQSRIKKEYKIVILSGVNNTQHLVVEKREKNNGKKMDPAKKIHKPESLKRNGETRRWKFVKRRNIPSIRGKERVCWQKQKKQSKSREKKLK